MYYVIVMSLFSRRPFRASIFFKKNFVDILIDAGTLPRTLQGEMQGKVIYHIHLYRMAKIRINLHYVHSRHKTHNYVRLLN